MIFFETLKNIKQILNDLNENKNILRNIFLNTIASVFELAGVALMIPLVHLLFKNQDFYLIKYLQNFFEIEDIILIFLIFFLLFYFLKTLIITLTNYYVQISSFKIQLNLSNQIYRKYVKKNYEFHVSNNSSKLLKNIAAESRLFAFIAINFFQFYSEILLLILITTFLIFFNPTSTMIALLVCAILLFLFFSIFKKRHVELSKIRSATEEDYFKFANETFDNIKTIKILLRENFFINRFEKKAALSSKTYGMQNYLTSLPKIWVEFIAFFLFFIIILISLKFQRQITLETFTLIAVYAAAAFRLIPSINRIIYTFQFILNNSAGIKILLNELNIKEDIENKSQKPIMFQRNININNLSYSYDKKIILNDLSLNIKKNEFIGIKGKSGSGKTTFIDILSGLKASQEGSILVDDNLISLSSSLWKKKIGYITQKTTILDDTIANNIIYGAERVDNHYLEKAINLSKLNQFIENQPNGINTIIGEKGSKISGGQIQRIGIARSIYSNPEILILDEPTNSLDSKTEKEFFEGLNLIKGQITIILISHNNIVQNYCDSFYELIGGKFIKI